MLDKKAIVNQSSRLGNAFWGNIIAFSSILDKNSYNDILSSLPSHEKKSLESVQPHEVHTVYLDINDEFISAILGKLNDKAIKDNLVDIVHRYFIYISHLPLITSNITSLISFFEIIQFIENIISSGLGITNVKPFYRRTTPKFSFYAEYFDNFGEFYIEK